MVFILSKTVTKAQGGVRVVAIGSPSAGQFPPGLDRFCAKADQVQGKLEFPAFFQGIGNSDFQNRFAAVLRSLD
jgi:hypothetical protein